MENAGTSMSRGACCQIRDSTAWSSATARGWASAIVMADIGANSIVSAGSVVLDAVAEESLVAGTRLGWCGNYSGMLTESGWVESMCGIRGFVDFAGPLGTRRAFA